MENSFQFRSALAVAAFLLSCSSHANLFINDGGFEKPEDTSPWTLASNAPSLSHVSLVNDPLNAHSGDGFGLFNPSDDNGNGSFSQVVSLNPSTLYRLDFSVRLLGSGTATPAPTFTFKFGGKLFSEFKVYTDPNDLTDDGQSVTVDGAWTNYSTFIQTEGAGGFAGGLIEFAFAGDTGSEGSIDSVRLGCANDEQNFECVRQSVPEPGSLTLVGLALAGLGVARRRQKA